MKIRELTRFSHRYNRDDNINAFADFDTLVYEKSRDKGTEKNIGVRFYLQRSVNERKVLIHDLTEEQFLQACKIIFLQQSVISLATYEVNTQPQMTTNGQPI